MSSSIREPGLSADSHISGERTLAGVTPTEDSVATGRLRPRTTVDPEQRPYLQPFKEAILSVSRDEAISLIKKVGTSEIGDYDVLSNITLQRVLGVPGLELGQQIWRVPSEDEKRYDDYCTEFVDQFRDSAARDRESREMRY